MNKLQIILIKDGIVYCQRADLEGNFKNIDTSDLTGADIEKTFVPTFIDNYLENYIDVVNPEKLQPFLKADIQEVDPKKITYSEYQRLNKSRNDRLIEVFGLNVAAEIRKELPNAKIIEEYDNAVDIEVNTKYGRYIFGVYCYYINNDFVHPRAGCIDYDTDDLYYSFPDDAFKLQDRRNIQAILDAHTFREHQFAISGEPANSTDDKLREVFGKDVSVEIRKKLPKAKITSFNNRTVWIEVKTKYRDYEFMIDCDYKDDNVHPVIDTTTYISDNCNFQVDNIFTEKDRECIQTILDAYPFEKGQFVWRFD